MHSVLIHDLHKLEKQHDKLITSNAELRQRIMNLRATEASPHVIDLFVRIADRADLDIAEIGRCVHDARSHISQPAQS